MLYRTWSFHWNERSSWVVSPSMHHLVWVRLCCGDNPVLSKYLWPKTIKIYLELTLHIPCGLAVDLCCIILAKGSSPRKQPLSGHYGKRKEISEWLCTSNEML